MAILLIMSGVLVHQLESVFIKKYNSKHKKGGFIFTAMVSFFAMLFFVISDTNGLQIERDILSYALICGILYSSASVLTYMALEIGSFVMSNLILSYSLLFPIGYGIIFLKEPVSVYMYLGIIIMVVSLFLVRGKKDDDSGVFSAKWLFYILTSAIGSGVLAIVLRMQQIRFDNERTNEIMVLALGFSAIVLFLIGVFKDRKDLGYILKNGSVYATFAGLSNGVTNLIYLFVNTLIPISVASPTKAGTKIVLSFAISKILFKEKFLKRQLAGVVLGTLALILLNI